MPASVHHAADLAIERERGIQKNILRQSKGGKKTVEEKRSLCIARISRRPRLVTTRGVKEREKKKRGRRGRRPEEKAGGKSRTGSPPTVKYDLLFDDLAGEREKREGRKGKKKRGRCRKAFLYVERLKGGGERGKKREARGGGKSDRRTFRVDRVLEEVEREEKGGGRHERGRKGSLVLCNILQSRP